MSDNLEVELIYLYPKENATLHKTDKFEFVHDEDNPIPILRRGLKFTMAIRFIGRTYRHGEDVLRLIFNYGPNPNPIKGTKGIIRFDPQAAEIEDNKHWYAGFLGESVDSITLEVFAPPDCPVGIWNLQVETSNENSTSEPSLFDYENEVYLLFNPWNCHDLVYMPDERLLDEYVLTDVGKIWVGPWGSSRGRECVFGQFDACVLPAIMLMFERLELTSTR